ncbi:hypothetical protein EJ997_08030 [Flaviflexus ciconiae]|uniref:Uncharacterized protein n=1 Tax=Flaviflexus ciconiae TaxID=2496867 RepID=A0A3S9PY77_9ACTO|nr:hypothetical protein [Flaviflexus ciconiae]AZQ77285.1 hypothetical protein EJ997_08030 [Flaviflexus ciconiae]
MESEQPEFYVTNPRRAPRYGRFMFLGAVLGAIAGLLIVQFGPGAGYYAIGDVVTATLLTAVPVGIFLGALVALLLDRKSLKKSKKLD